jgi:flagellar basal-body rod modification protein FlgD
MANFDMAALDGMGMRTSFSDEKAKAKETKQDFLKLFMAQLQHQDPLSPQEGADFLAQLAQFSTVEGIENMNKSMHGVHEALTESKALQAAQLVGRKVEMMGDTTRIHAGENEFIGGIHLDRSVNDLSLTIENEQGELLETVPLGMHAGGTVSFGWKGDPGLYKVHASATVDGQKESMRTSVFSTVQSVTLSNSEKGVVLNTTNQQSVPLSEARSIG